MNAREHDGWPPEAWWSEREPLPQADAPVHGTAIAGLDAVASTLLIPLAARAHGDAMWPRVALGDAHAARLLAALGADASPFLAHRASVFGVLVRSAVFRSRAQDFFGRRPATIGASLGAGLGHYFQWLDNGHNRWVDADVPEVTQLRDRLLPCAGPRRVNAPVDLAQPGWWRRLGLPTGRDALPVLLICEGVSMFLQPAQMAALLHEIGAFAPPGTRLLVDVMNSLAIGRARRHPSVRHTGAEFHWGMRRLDELTAPHRRLRIDAVHPVMERYGWPYSVLGPAFRFVFGVPFYAVVELGVDA